jgi:hypothetical protein
VFPDDEGVELGQATLREDAFEKERFQKEGEAFMKESAGEFRFTLPISIPLEGESIHLDFDMRVRRTGFTDFKAWVQDLRVAEAPPEEPTPEEATPEEPGDGEDAPPEEKTGD